MSFATETRLKKANIVNTATATATDKSTVSQVARPRRLRICGVVDTGTEGGGDPSAAGCGVAACCGVAAPPTDVDMAAGPPPVEPTVSVEVEPTVAATVAEDAAGTSASSAAWPRSLTWSVQRLPSQ